MRRAHLVMDVGRARFLLAIYRTRLAARISASAHTHARARWRARSRTREDGDADGHERDGASEHSDRFADAGLDLCDCDFESDGRYYSIHDHQQHPMTRMTICRFFKY